MTKTNILQETVNMLSLEIYPSLHYEEPLFKHTDGWRLYNIIRQAIPSINDPAAKKVDLLPNISRTELFIKFKTITTCVLVCIVNRQRSYIAQSVYHNKKLGHILDDDAHSAVA